jgi:hypothetical protein
VWCFQLTRTDPWDSINSLKWKLQLLQKSMVIYRQTYSQKPNITHASYLEPCVQIQNQRLATLTDVYRHVSKFLQASGSTWNGDMTTSFHILWISPKITVIQRNTHKQSKRNLKYLFCEGIDCADGKVFWILSVIIHSVRSLHFSKLLRVLRNVT